MLVLNLNKSRLVTQEHYVGTLSLKWGGALRESKGDAHYPSHLVAGPEGLASQLLLIVGGGVYAGCI